MKYFLQFTLLNVLFLVFTTLVSANVLENKSDTLFQEGDEIIQNYVASTNSVEREYKYLIHYIDSIIGSPIVGSLFITGNYTMEEYRDYIKDIHIDWREYIDDQCEEYEEEDSATTKVGTFYHICKTEMNNLHKRRLRNFLDNLREAVEQP